METSFKCFKCSETLDTDELHKRGATWALCRGCARAYAKEQAGDDWKPQRSSRRLKQHNDAYIVAGSLASGVEPGWNGVPSARAIARRSA